MPEVRGGGEGRRPPVIRLILAWSLVGIPLLWGISQTLLKALALFK